MDQAISRPLSINRHTYQQCPVCGSTKINAILVAKDYTVSSETFSIWQCNNCLLRFTQDIPVQEEIGAYYKSEEYISHSGTRKGLVNQLYHIVRNFTLKQKLKLVNRESGKKAGSILDIGCGTGEFLNTMKEAKWQVNGLEPDPDAREFARKEYGIQVGPSEDISSLASDSADVISMWHVIEHVHELDNYLEEISRILKKDGLLLIAVPNYQSLDADHYDSQWAAYDVPRHLYHFSPKSMRHLLQKFEFVAEKLSPMPFDAFYVSLLSEKYQHGNMKLIPGAWTGFRSFLRAQRNVENSSSILYIIRRSK